MNEETKKDIVSIARQIYALPLPSLAEVSDANPQGKAMYEMVHTLKAIQESWFCSMLVFLPERFPLNEEDMAWAMEKAVALGYQKDSTE